MKANQTFAFVALAHFFAHRFSQHSFLIVAWNFSFPFVLRWFIAGISFIVFQTKRRSAKSDKNKVNRNLSLSFAFSLILFLSLCNSILFSHEMNFHLSLSILGSSHGSVLSLFNCNPLITFISKWGERLNWNWISTFA